ncbi:MULTISPECIES: hypothetical protein [unclassified Pseudomonas]|uniref:hypothetical protein n=1 Tax=unclassified Pseudomonas TaxID=196821 RepID=UPI002097455A|nr:MULTISPECIES: hypothetical protein [unclassified Pseudomonas]MCO7522684.1 hypothetical protein [Pseudomonas sp. 1]MCO7543106.1 hypothetical protein [Pseudomonas sp. VA159-2]
MDFNTSSEQHVLAGNAAQIARKKVKDALVEILRDVSLECGAEAWTFISILMPDERIGDYPEVRRYHKARKVIEVRVQIPIYEFRDSDALRQVSLILDAVSRSVEMMEEIKSLKLTVRDAHVLKDAVENARVQLGVA